MKIIQVQLLRIFALHVNTCDIGVHYNNMVSLRI